jgi:hypothetical protein
MSNEINCDEARLETLQKRLQSLQVEIDALREIACDLLYKNQLIRMRLERAQWDHLVALDLQDDLRHFPVKLR